MLTPSSKPLAGFTLPRGTTRRWLAQVHLWIALALGLYIVVLSVSGSAIVFRRELTAWLVPRNVPSAEGVQLTGDSLRGAIESVYRGDTIVTVREPTRAGRPVFVTIERRGKQTDRLFDPYALQDLGDTFPPTLRALEWLVELHDDLLAGPTGRFVNGIGGLLVMLLIATGAWIWWPGTRNVWRSITLGKPAASRRFARQVHNVLGFWTFALLFVWAFTAVYFAFPEPFELAMDLFDDDLTDFERPGEAALLQLIKLHFGRFGGLSVRFTWVVLGLAPAALFVTGFILWWTRVVRRKNAAPESANTAA